MKDLSYFLLPLSSPISYRNKGKDMLYATSTMKLLFALLPALAHSQLSCPDPLGHEYPVNDELTMYFDVVLSEPNVTDGSILCARFESLNTGWIGFGISPTKEMIGAEAIIGVPANGTVKKYILFGKDVSMVTPMDEADQTLMDTSITQDAEGRTTMTFTKYMFEDKYGILPNDFINSFIWATGSTNELGYHAARGNFGMDLLTTMSPVSAPPSIAVGTGAPSVSVGNETLVESSAPSVAAAGGESLAPSMTVTTSSGATEGKDPVASSAPTVMVTSGVSSSPTMIDAVSTGSTGSTAAAAVSTQSGSTIAAAVSTQSGSTIVAAVTTETGVETTAAAAVVTTAAPVEVNATEDVTDDGMGDDASNGVGFSVEGAEKDNSSASMKTGGFLLVTCIVLSSMIAL